MSERYFQGQWLKNPDGFIDRVGDKPVCEYEGCGTHRAVWGNEADYDLAINAPALRDALESVLEAANKLGHDMTTALDKAIRNAEKVLEKVKS